MHNTCVVSSIAFVSDLGFLGVLVSPVRDSPCSLCSLFSLFHLPFPFWGLFSPQFAFVCVEYLVQIKCIIF